MLICEGLVTLIGRILNKIRPSVLYIVFLFPPTSVFRFNLQVKLIESTKPRFNEMIVASQTSNTSLNLWS
ncbi:hypothetical protein Hanom_Chr00s000001g01595531 [Helianthus anomalus]